MAGGLEPGLRDEGHIIGLGAGDWINLIASLLERFPHIILCLGHLKENMPMTKLSVNAIAFSHRYQISKENFHIRC